MKKYYSPYFVSFLWLLLYSSCKKEINKSDLQENVPVKILNTNNSPRQYLVQAFANPLGGYTAIGQMSVTSDNVDITATLFDAQFHTISHKHYGKSGFDGAFAVTTDNEGNIYTAGSTTSSILRMDLYKTYTNLADAYLAKMNKYGELLWQRGYCDTTSYWGGSAIDVFDDIFIMDDKIYCLMTSSSYRSPTVSGSNFIIDMGLVVFDKNGNFIQQKLFKVPKVPDPKSYRANYTFKFCRVQNDIVFTYVPERTLTYAPSDTMGVMFKYNLALDKVLWNTYFLKSKNEADIHSLSLTPSGDLMALNYRTSNIEIITFDAANGMKKATYPTGLNNMNHLYGPYSLVPEPFLWKTTTLGNDMYILGGYYPSPYFNDKLGQLTPIFLGYCNPWVLKLNAQGQTVYSKTYPIVNALFGSVFKTPDNNLNFLGVYSNLTSYQRTDYFMCITDPDGNLINH